MGKQGESNGRPEVARPPESGGIVLVGTFRPENAGWIKGRKLYNLPLPAEGATAFHRSVSRVVLVAEGEGTLAYAARFEREVDGAELAALGYRAAARGAAHGDRYALYRLGAKLSPTRALRAADVFVSSSRCPKVRIDAGFYGRPYPKTGGRSMPHVFDALKPHFGKWRSAVTFDPMQKDFMQIMYPERKFPAMSPLEYAKGKIRKRGKDCRVRQFRMGEFFCGPGGLACGALSARIEVPGCRIVHAWSNDYGLSLKVSA